MILPGYTQLVFSHSLGGTYIRPVRGVVFHTTEGTTIDGAVSVYSRMQACPHLTVDPETKELYQHVPLDRSCYALRNLAGGCETNTTGVIQIEIVEYAANTWSWGEERKRWLGEAVLAPILAGFPAIPHEIYTGARMNCDEWNTWPGGLCGHRDIPEQDHTDPGDLDLASVLHYALGNDSPLENDMAISDEDAKKIAEAVWTRVIDSSAGATPAAQHLGYLYDEIKKLPRGAGGTLTYDDVLRAVTQEMKRQAAIIAAT